jgi:hypothetical protein
MRVGVVILAAELLKSLASSLWNEEGSKTADKHEKSIDLKNMVHPGSLIILSSTVGTKGRDGSLPNNRSNFAGRGRDTVRSGSVAGGKDFTGDNEGGSIWT